MKTKDIHYIFIYKRKLLSHRCHLVPKKINKKHTNFHHFKWHSAQRTQEFFGCIRDVTFLLFLAHLNENQWPLVKKTHTNFIKFWQFWTSSPKYMYKKQFFGGGFVKQTQNVVRLVTSICFLVWNKKKKSTQQSIHLPEQNESFGWPGHL